MFLSTFSTRMECSQILLFSVMSQILMSTCHRRLVSNYMMSHKQCDVIRDFDYVYFNLTFVFYFKVLIFSYAFLRVFNHKESLLTGTKHGNCPMFIEDDIEMQFDQAFSAEPALFPRSLSSCNTRIITNSILHRLL